VRELPVASPFPVYAFEHIRWSTPGGSAPSYQIAGSGIYAVFDPAAGGQHSLSLNVAINANAGQVQLYSGSVTRAAPFPTIEITATEDSGNNQHRYQIHLIAEPRRVYQFSTEIGFGSWQPAGVVPMSDGDLLATSGRRYRANAQLTQHLGIMPPAPDIGLDAVVLTPATASAVFSSEVDVFSEWLGPLQDGDLLNEHGFVFRTNQ
jgi:hypothetical protein